MAQHRTKPDKNNFIHAWLKKQNPAPDYKAFQHLPLAEIDGARDIVLRPLAETVFTHHNDPEEFRENLKALGYSKAAEALDKRPRTPNTRKGNFGEILASEFLNQSEGYQIPIYRLRYNPNPDSPMKGDDVLAFKFGEPNGKGREIVVVEAKVRSQFSSKAVEDAYKKLENGHRPRPTSITFVVTILHKENRGREAKQVLGFLKTLAPHQPIRRNLLFLVTGNCPSDPFSWIHQRKNVMKNLITVNLSISNLDDFVKKLFDYEAKVNGL
jgi:hypothetical protein